jgi:hypothetical protein
MKPATDYKKEADFEPAPIRKISGGWQFRPRSYTDPTQIRQRAVQTAFSNASRA